VTLTATANNNSANPLKAINGAITTRKIVSVKAKLVPEAHVVKLAVMELKDPKEIAVNKVSVVPEELLGPKAAVAKQDLAVVLENKERPV
jgi:hypothetical protein